MQWWQRALATITGVTGLCVAFNQYNEYYKERGQVHPITAFIARHTSDEEEDRRKRIDDLRMQGQLADLRRLRPRQALPGQEMATEEPEDIDQFLYGDEAEHMQQIAAAEADAAAAPETATAAVADEPTEALPAAESSMAEEGEEEDDDYDDLEIVFDGSSKPSEPAKRTAVSMMASSKEDAAAAAAKPSVDVHTPGMLNGEAIYNVELDSLPEKPWRQPGADITDYFNYGFVEHTWREYCAKQKTIRDELGTQKRIAVFDGSAVPALPFVPPQGGAPGVRPPMLPPGMPPFPFPPPGGAAFPFPPPPPFMFPGVAPVPAATAPAIVMPGAEKDDTRGNRDSHRDNRDKDPRDARRSVSRRDGRSRSRSRSRERDSKRRR